jgi:ATP synthase I chain
MTARALLAVMSKQRRTLLVGVLLCAGVFWIAVPAGKPEIGLFFSVGVVLSFINHVMTEVSLYNSLQTSDGISRKQFAMGSLGRLALITLVALAIVAMFWPYGATVLIGLALMHLVMLLFTGLPLLNEMRKA